MQTAVKQTTNRLSQCHSPHEQGFDELDDDDEAQRDENEAQVDEQHQAAHAADVRAEGVRRRHGLDLGAHPPLRVHAAASLSAARHRVDAARLRVVGPVRGGRVAADLRRGLVHGARHVNVAVLAAGVVAERRRSARRWPVGWTREGAWAVGEVAVATL